MIVPHEEYRKAIEAAIAAARKAGMKGSDIAWQLRSSAASVAREWNAEVDRRNAQRIAEQRQMT
jgi:hypothetical protein